MNDELENTISSDETVEETQDTVENTQEGLTEEPTVQEEETQEEEVQEQEDEIFNPDDLDFSESPEDYKFGDYDLSEFKDVIDLTRDDVREALNTKANELKEQGFTQQQISYLFKKKLNMLNSKIKDKP